MSRRSGPRSISRRRATRASRPSTSGSPCARRSLPLGDFGRILAYLREAETLAAGPRRSPSAGTGLGLHVRHFWTMGDYDQAIAVGQRALALATASRGCRPAGAGEPLPWAQPTRPRVTIVGRSSCLQADCGVPRRRRGAVSASVRLFLPSVQSRAWLAWCHAELGAFAEGSALGEEGLRIAEAVDAPRSLMHALHRGWVCCTSAKGTCARPSPCSNGPGTLPGRGPPAPGPQGGRGTWAHAYALSGRVAEALPLLDAGDGTGRGHGQVSRAGAL